ncbi:MAG: Ca-activated chloride channel [Verrucomicrobiota bacterium]
MNATNGLRDIKPPVVIPTGWALVFWIAGIVAFAALMAWLWRYWQKRRAQIPQVPVIPPHVRAKQRLAEALSLIGQPREFCILVSDIIRHYLEERFEFHAPDRTTEEFLHELRSTDRLTVTQKESLGGFLQSCDLVKFARYEPGESELRDLHGSAVSLVEETEPRPVLAQGGEGSGSATNSTVQTLSAVAAEGLLSFWDRHFGHPWLLLLLLLLPLFAWLKGKRGQPPAFVYSSVQLVRGIVNVSRTRIGAILSALRWLILALFIIALARPRLTSSETTIKESGVDIVVALDLSGSMASEDFEVGRERVNRLNMAKEVLKKFVDKRPSDRIGLIAFATMAYIAAPLTLDHDYLLQNLERLQIGSIDESQTAIGSALSTALNRLREVKSKSKIVILMTDGQNNAGKVAPLTVAEAAQALRVKVYTIGVGMRGQAPMPFRDVFGRKQYRMMPVDIDEDTLQKIANMTGGKYYRADNAKNFQAIYAEIDKLEKTEEQVKKYTHYQELFGWVVSPGLGLLLLEMLLRHTVWRRLP